MNKIYKKIEELFDSKGSFAKFLKIDFRDLSSKMQTVEGKIKWLDEFLEPLNLKVKIVDNTN